MTKHIIFQRIFKNLVILDHPEMFKYTLVTIFKQFPNKYVQPETMLELQDRQSLVTYLVPIPRHLEIDEQAPLDDLELLVRDLVESHIQYDQARQQMQLSEVAQKRGSGSILKRSLICQFVRDMAAPDGHGPLYSILKVFYISVPFEKWEIQIYLPKF